MLNQMTMERLRLMKLRGMSRAFEEQADNPAMQHLSFEERFGLIVVDFSICPRTAHDICRKLTA